eukprot:COSAG03_NODE_3058_length_2256_cov_2.095039_1_plen_21_part_10
MAGDEAYAVHDAPAGKEEKPA